MFLGNITDLRSSLAHCSQSMMCQINIKLNCNLKITYGLNRVQVFVFRVCLGYHIQLETLNWIFLSSRCSVKLG